MSSAIAPLPPAGADPPPPKPHGPAEAAQQFESLLIAQMLRSGMQPSDDQADSGMDTMLDVAADQFARLMAAAGGLGLAKLIRKGLVSPTPSGP